ncbi:putative camp-dependent protein kinase [Basidiobolus meristosporus CBS 931.73]|uniref:Putative camp-dependent protein kinase n=1 Tax=Basidiobolus meristosporus CBS 931.73 TaxID=1314790 RepID=A0A1Y1YYR3_9FUNG|nr:putative camp-dependent protein kinase [Basidiobolus meristosporus CBS 931.73]|eukprot:ORY03171.1 putative camp-dependent protein kinase [Basidiobolus meristosporus CBS 931.73]
MGALCCKEEEIDFSNEVELYHFNLLRSVGKGAFGKVRIVQHKRTKQLYALKYINKHRCIRMRAVENIIQERRLLEEIDFPLVCNLRYAFQDDENMFMVLDLMLGGDLRFHLDRQGPMREEVVRFYVAEIALGLRYLHSKHIVHRDLKPDNILLDEKGHAHLTDFNIAVQYKDKALKSVAGSLAYMAPEVLSKKGYYGTVDWWSLGVVAYELLFGKRPFRAKTNDALTAAIMNEDLTFPTGAQDVVTEDAMDAIRGLCERDIQKRLGCGDGGFERMKEHPWFKDIEWEKLPTKEAKPPFEPDSKHANFDATHELEELLLEDNPLKARKRKDPSKRTKPLPKEMQVMEERFLMYDYTRPKIVQRVLSHESSYMDLTAPDKTALDALKTVDTFTMGTLSQISGYTISTEFSTVPLPSAGISNGAVTSNTYNTRAYNDDMQLLPVSSASQDPANKLSVSNGQA